MLPTCLGFDLHFLDVVPDGHRHRSMVVDILRPPISGGRGQHGLDHLRGTSAGTEEAAPPQGLRTPDTSGVTDSGQSVDKPNTSRGVVRVHPENWQQGLRTSLTTTSPPTSTSCSRPSPSSQSGRELATSVAGGNLVSSSASSPRSSTTSFGALGTPHGWHVLRQIVGSFCEF